MNLGFSCNGTQLRNYYQKYKLGKISSMNMLKATERCETQVAKMEIILNLTKSPEKFNQEDFDYYVTNVYPFMFRNISRCYNTASSAQDKIYNLFKCNVSFESKQKVFSLMILKNVRETNTLNILKEEKILSYQEQIDCILYLVDFPDKAKSDILKKMIQLINFVNDGYKNDEVKNFSYKSINEKILNNPSLILSEYDRGALKKLVSEHYKDYVSETDLYYYVKDSVKNSIGSNYTITHLMNKNFPFGMVVKSFVEIFTKDVMSVEEEMVEQFNAAQVALKLMGGK